MHYVYTHINTTLIHIYPYNIQNEMDDIDADMLPEDLDLTGIPEEGHNSDLDGDGEGEGEGEGSVGMNMSMIMNSGSSSSSIVRSTRSPMSNHNSKKNKNKYKKQFAFSDNVGLSYEDNYDLTLTTTDLNAPNADVSSSHQPINRYPFNNINKSKVMSLQDPSMLIPISPTVTRSRSRSLSQPSVTTRSPRSDDDTFITTIPPLPPLPSLPLPSLPPSLQQPQKSQEQTSTTGKIANLQESTLAPFASKDIPPPTTSQQTRKNRRHSEPFTDRISSSAEFTALTYINNINNNTLTRTRMPSSSSGGDDASDNSPPHIRQRSAHITSASYDNIVDLHTRTLLGQNSLETTTPYRQLKRSKSERKSGLGPALSTHAKADRVTKQASKKMRSIGASLWPSMRNQVYYNILYILVLHV